MLLEGVRGASTISCHTETLRLTLHRSLTFTLPSYLSQSLLPPLPISPAPCIIPGYLAILASFWTARSCNPPQTLLRTSSLLVSSSGSCQHPASPGFPLPEPNPEVTVHFSKPLLYGLYPLALGMSNPVPCTLCELPISEYSPAQHQVEHEKMQLSRTQT